MTEDYSNTRNITRSGVGNKLYDQEFTIIWKVESESVNTICGDE